MSRPLYPSDLACKSLSCSLMILVLLFLAVLECSAAPLTQAEAARVSLELAKPIERALAGNETHSYAITLTSGQYAQIVVDQRGVDVVVTVAGSEGSKLFEVDSPHNTHLTGLLYAEMAQYLPGDAGTKTPPCGCARAAQVSMSKDPRWHQAHYWAAFTLQGEWR